MGGLRRINVGSSEYVSFLQSLLSPNFWIACQGLKFGSKGERSAFPESIRPLRRFVANRLAGHRRRAYLPDHKGDGRRRAAQSIKLGRLLKVTTLKRFLVVPGLALFASCFCFLLGFLLQLLTVIPVTCFCYLVLLSAPCSCSLNLANDVNS